MELAHGIVTKDSNHGSENSLIQHRQKPLALLVVTLDCPRMKIKVWLAERSLKLVPAQAKRKPHIHQPPALKSFFRELEEILKR